MLARQLFVLCLTLVLFTRAVHCLYVDAGLCARAATAAGGTQPLSDPTESDPNESGCLCKGALVTAPCLIVDLETQTKLISAAQLVPAPAGFLPAWSTERTVQDLLWPPPRSGRMVRALLVSWQI